MDTQIIDGKKSAEQKQAELKKIVSKLPRPPKLAVILVGDNPASQIYVRNKMNAAKNVGIEAELFSLSPIMTQDALLAFIDDLNKDASVDGILVQMPLPDNFDAYTVIEKIDPKKDADGLHSLNLGKLFTGEPALVPCTPLACLDLIKQACPQLEGMNVVIIGRSRLVGKPLAQLLLAENCTVTQAHSKTRNLSEVCRQADILVSAVGRAGLVTEDFIKPGAVVIDVGINKNEQGKLCGDVVYNQMLGKAGAVTPVPGGVGPMTVTMLLQNTISILLKKNDFL